MQGLIKNIKVDKNQSPDSNPSPPITSTYIHTYILQLQALFTHPKPQIPTYIKILLNLDKIMDKIPMQFLGMDFTCAFSSLSNGTIPHKDCLLPLISKLLGYAIVAASTTVKLPQVHTLSFLT